MVPAGDLGVEELIVSVLGRVNLVGCGGIATASPSSCINVLENGRNRRRC